MRDPRIQYSLRVCSPFCSKDRPHGFGKPRAGVFLAISVLAMTCLVLVWVLSRILIRSFF